jgi:hypothetical protein
MNLRFVIACILTITVMGLMSSGSAQNLYRLAGSSVVVIQVYKGELQISVPQQQRDSLLLRYRAKNREVMRIGISVLKLTNTRTQEVTRLSDRSASLANRIDQDGYWFIDIPYSGLELGDDNYRVDGRLTQYLSGSQRTRNFSVYLRPETVKRPADSTIDWGVTN